MAAEKCLEVASIFDIYEQALRERDAVDFGDLIMRPALLLESDPAVARLPGFATAICSSTSIKTSTAPALRLLKAVAGDGKRLWVVGDARQSIYRFRGASATNMAHFGTDYVACSLRSARR